MGSKQGSRQVTKKLRRMFPRLFGNEYQVTSIRTRKYNCIAWAVGDPANWWDEPPDGVWPTSVPFDGTVLSLVHVFKSLGYRRADRSDLEPGYEKVAIFGDRQGYTHVARQQPNGKWTSKIGRLQDIEHDQLEALTGRRYGRVKRIMKRTSPTV